MSIMGRGFPRFSPDVSVGSQRYMKQRKIIVTCAVTGAIHTPSMSPYLPISAREIEDAAVGAAEAGASIVHLHAREPGTGRPSQDP